MSQGQKCSLRFHLEGDMLMPTGTVVWPGMSGDRLRSILPMLTDLGYCTDAGGADLRLTDDGTALLQALESEA